MCFNTKILLPKEQHEGILQARARELPPTNKVESDPDGRVKEPLYWPPCENVSIRRVTIVMDGINLN